MTPPGRRATRAHPSVWEMDVKSWINAPGARGRPGQRRPGADPRRGHGRHAQPAARRSLDRRRQTWQEARLSAPTWAASRGASSCCRCGWQPGSYVLASRAQDAQFNWQVEPAPRTPAATSTAAGAPRATRSRWRDAGASCAAHRAAPALALAGCRGARRRRPDAPRAASCSRQRHAGLRAVPRAQGRRRRRRGRAFARRAQAGRRPGGEGAAATASGRCPRSRS